MRVRSKIHACHLGTVIGEPSFGVYAILWDGTQIVSYLYRDEFEVIE